MRLTITGQDLIDYQEQILYPLWVRELLDPAGNNIVEHLVEKDAYKMVSLLLKLNSVAEPFSYHMQIPQQIFSKIVKVGVPFYGSHL